MTTLEKLSAQTASDMGRHFFALARIDPAKDTKRAAVQFTDGTIKEFGQCLNLKSGTAGHRLTLENDSTSQSSKFGEPADNLSSGVRSSGLVGKKKGHSPRDTCLVACVLAGIALPRVSEAVPIPQPNILLNGRTAGSYLHDSGFVLLKGLVWSQRLDINHQHIDVGPEFSPPDVGVRHPGTEESKDSAEDRENGLVHEFWRFVRAVGPVAVVCLGWPLWLFIRSAISIRISERLDEKYRNGGPQ